MNCYDGKHWNIYDILPFQRNFNFVNSTRTVGKTYTFQKFATDKAIEKCLESVYIVRTQDEIKDGILKEAFEKVLSQEFSDYKFKYKKDEIYLIEEDDLGNEVPRRIWVALAISAYVKIKKRSFPKVKYIMFDEYMLEDPKYYVDGWQEVEHFMTIYHTIDRDENRVICFFFGNNTAFHNPYHLYKSFNIPYIDEGKIWKSKNVIFQRAVKSEQLKQEQSGSFSDMMEGTDYAKSYMQGTYTNDNFNFIEPLSGYSKYICTLCLSKTECGVYFDSALDTVYISRKVDKSCRSVYAIKAENSREGAVIVGRKGSSIVRWLRRKYQYGRVRYENIQTKLMTEKDINYLA